MLPIPTLSQTVGEQWPDEDFDLPDGDHPICIPSADDDDQKTSNHDWNPEATVSSQPFHQILPPPPPDEEPENDVSTIKVSTLAQNVRPPPEDDVEVDLELPRGLSQLSLRPLHHRSSKSSFDGWEERDSTPSSCSTASLSEPYSSLGLTHATSPSSNSSHSRVGSQVETETDDDTGEGDLDGLILPSSIFESRNGGKELARMLDVKKNLPAVVETTKFTSPDEETDFETGIIINEDVDLSPSRLVTAHTQQQLARGAGKTFVRSRSNPSRPSSAPVRAPSRLRSSESSVASSGRAESPAPIQPSKSPQITSQTSTHVTARIRNSNGASTSAHSTTVQSSRVGSIRNQKSISGLKTTSTHRALGRKASLSSLFDGGSGDSSSAGGTVLGTYNASTAASRAKTQYQQQQHNTSSRAHLSSEHNSLSSIGSFRALSPSFQSSSHLTLPSPLTRHTKHRTPISAIFPSPPSITTTEERSPVSSASGSSRTTTTRPPASFSGLSSVKVLRKPRRGRLYGDGTELDSIEDLPTDGDKESRFRVAPKVLPSNRIPGGTYHPDSTNPAIRDVLQGRGTLRKRDPITLHSTPEASKPRQSNVLRRKARIDDGNAENKSPKKPSSQNNSHARRKPTLIRNLSGAGGPKVIGEMRWNPQSLRWEGNEQILRDFDAVTGTSTRPALITHLTGSSVGSPKSGLSTGVRIVGNMVFDPIRMCWLSRLPPEEDEPDVFADMTEDGDENEEEWMSKGGTIRAGSTQTRHSDVSSSSGGNISHASEAGISSTSEGGRMSESEGESQVTRASRRILSVPQVDDTFVEQCRAAVQLHEREISWWFAHEGSGGPERVRQRLHYIRDLATRTY